MAAVSVPDSPTRRGRRPKKAREETGVAPRRWHTPYLLLAPGLLWLIVFFIVPLISLGRLSLEDGGLSNYSNVISDNSEVIVRTFVLRRHWPPSGAIIIGYPLAYVIATKGGRFKSLLLALVVLPFFVTYLVRTLAWKILLFDGGPVVELPARHRRPRLGRRHPRHAGRGDRGAHLQLPAVHGAADLRQPREDGPAPARGGRRPLLHRPARAFRRVTLPLSLPGLFAGTLLTFIPAAGDFVNSELLGSERTVMIGNVIEKNFGKEFFRPELSALSFMLMAIILVGVIIYARVLGTEDLA